MIYRRYAFKLVVFVAVLGLRHVASAETTDHDDSESQCCTGNMGPVRIDDRRLTNPNHSRLLLDELFAFQAVKLCEDVRVATLRVAVKLNPDAAAEFKMSNGSVPMNGSLGIGIIILSDSNLLQSVIVQFNFTVNTTNVTILNLDFNRNVSGGYLRLQVKHEWSVGVVAVSQSNIVQPSQVINVVTYTGDTANFYGVQYLTSWSPMFSVITKGPRLPKPSPRSCLSKSDDVNTELIVVLMFVVVAVCVLIVVSILLCACASKARAVRRKIMLGSAVEMTGRDADFMATYVSTSEQYSAIRALVNGNDYFFLEPIDCNSADEGEDEESTNLYIQPPNELGLLQEMLKDSHCLEIPRKIVKFEATIGQGNFGTVCQGRIDTNVEQIVVALKIINKEATAEDKVAVLQEAAIMGQFRHPHVVWLFGVIAIGEPMILVLELMENGDLKNYLTKLQLNQGNQETTDPKLPNQLLQFCIEVAKGMQYLTSKMFVHRDLAARNILLSREFTCKISDFGLSRDLSNSEYYTTGGGQIPVRWTAPEALKHGKYSTDSDIWSYGMLLFEIWSLGTSPYPRLTAEKVLRKHALVSRPQGPPKVLLSAVAGVTIADMKKAYGESPVGDGEKTDFIFSRCVPNLATAVGEGVCCVSVEEDRKDHADCSSLLELLSLLGYCRLLPEHLMSATTACAGSGLGFMMVVLEAMSDAGVLVGHSRATAQEMAIQVMMGAAKLCKEEKLHPAQIKDSVCSPGGTTITGVHELERCGLRNSILSACKAARDKADAFGKK